MMHPKWRKGRESSIQGIRIDIFPPAVFDKYRSDMSEELHDKKYSTEFMSDDTILYAQGGPLFPDVIQIHLNPEFTVILFKYLFYAYLGKKTLNGFLSLAKKASESIATELGKDLYLKIKGSIRKLLLKDREPEDQTYSEKMRIYLRGYLGETVLTLKLLPHTYKGQLTDTDIDYFSEQTLSQYIKKFLPIISQLVDIMGHENTYAQTEVLKWSDGYKWRVLVQKAYFAEEPHKKYLAIMCDFDTNGHFERVYSWLENEGFEESIPESINEKIKKFENSILKQNIG